VKLIGQADVVLRGFWLWGLDNNSACHSLSLILKLVALDLEDAGLQIRGKLVLPEAHCGDAFRLQQSHDFSMPQFISGDLGLPEGLIGLRDMTTPFTSMPKTSVDKDRKVLFGKEEVRVANYALWMKGPAVDFGAHERHSQAQFSGLVASPPDCRHNLRTHWRNIAESAVGEFGFE
jgi:hypothetical protein